MIGEIELSSFGLWTVSVRVVYITSVSKPHDRKRVGIPFRNSLQPEFLWPPLSHAIVVEILAQSCPTVGYLQISGRIHDPVVVETIELRPVCGVIDASLTEQRTWYWAAHQAADFLRTEPAIDVVPVIELMVDLDAPRILLGPCGCYTQIVILQPARSG